jgi:hypothetical protein
MSRIIYRIDEQNGISIHGMGRVHTVAKLKDNCGNLSQQEI